MSCGVDPVADEAAQHDLAERVVADGADEDAAPADLRGLIDKDPRRAGRIGSGVGSGALVPSVPGRADELDQQIADAADSGALAHGGSLLPLAPPSFDLDIRRVNLKVDAGKILRWTFAAARGKGARICRA